MIILKKEINDHASARVSEWTPANGQWSRTAKAIRGGVGKPGGFTNTNHDPRAGGTVVLPGGFANTSFV